LFPPWPWRIKDQGHDFTSLWNAPKPICIDQHIGTHGKKLCTHDDNLVTKYVCKFCLFFLVWVVFWGQFPPTKMSICLPTLLSGFCTWQRSKKAATSLLDTL
jgi:hypothetical protein